jgi:hypothetical protein
MCSGIGELDEFVEFFEVMMVRRLITLSKSYSRLPREGSGGRSKVSPLPAPRPGYQSIPAYFAAEAYNGK